MFAEFKKNTVHKVSIAFCTSANSFPHVNNWSKKQAFENKILARRIQKQVSWNSVIWYRHRVHRLNVYLQTERGSVLMNLGVTGEGWK